MEISVVNLEEFNAEISRYAAVRGKTFEYASLRAVKNWIYNARNIIIKMHPAEETKSKIVHLYGECKLVAYLLRNIAEGNFGHGFTTTTKRSKRAKYYSAKDAKVFARTRLKSRTKSIRFKDAFAVAAQDWIKKHLNAMKPDYTGRDVTPTGKKAALTNNSRMSKAKNVSFVEVELLYMLKRQQTDAGKSSALSSFAFNAMYQDALAQALPIAIQDVRDYTDKELEKIK